jgi:DNA-binding response OmpR family regulator
VTGPVLVVEDDPDIALAIGTVLGRGGFDVVRALDGKSALREFHEQRPALVVLDIGLPVMDGWEVLRRIRDLSDTPVLMLTAHGYEADKTRGLEAGADDYLAKPFGHADLLARSRALLSRLPAPGGPHAADGEADCYDDGFLRVDQRSCEVRVNGVPVALTPIEFRLLTALARHPGQVLSPPQLLELAWNDPGRVGPDRVKFSIMRLRRKLGPAGPDTSPIEAVRGFGYRYARPGETPYSR